MGGIVELTPQAVRDYSVEGNSIHYEEKAAARAGFRAPIIGGGMGALPNPCDLVSETSNFFDTDIFSKTYLFGTKNFESPLATQSWRRKRKWLW